MYMQLNQQHVIDLTSHACLVTKTTFISVKEINMLYFYFLLMLHGSVSYIFINISLLL